jgi:L-alanine-DL-glutamate epimerase-like enolase superfamily enzyme
MAISALDHALWDLKARLLEAPLARLLGRVHESVPVYGSGGLTSYDLERLGSQLGDREVRGIPRVKMKVDRDPERDPERVRVAREAIGSRAELFVDGNGAVDVLQADVTRCGGITGFLQVGAPCEAFGVPLSAHTAPALSVHAAAAVGP